MNVSKRISAVSVAAIAFILTGCATQSLGPTAARNPIQVAESIERLELYTRPDGLELSARDKLAVSHFLDGYRQSGSGPLFINRPSAQAGQAGTQQAEAVVRGLMRDGGLNPSSLQGGQYRSNPNAPAPVVVSYRVLKAIPASCRRKSSTIDTFRNSAPSEFGCFHSANLAAMIGDPRQLLEPYTFGQPDAQRRQVVYDRYIQGDTTAAQFPSRQEIVQSGN